MKGYPALVDEGDSVAIRLFDDQRDQVAAMWDGNRRLLRLAATLSSKSVQRRLTNEARLALGWSPYPTVADLIEDCVTAALDELIEDAGGPAWDAVAFDSAPRQGR